jgi:hypothetical protein
MGVSSGDCSFGIVVVEGALGEENNIQMTQKKTLQNSNVTYNLIASKAFGEQQR